MRSLIIIGQRACGKTTLLREAQTYFDLPEAIDSDQALLHAFQAESIQQLYFRLGAEAFRKGEAETIKRLLFKPLLLATGAGAIGEPSSRQYLEQHGSILFLDTDHQTCFERIRLEGKGYLGSFDQGEWNRVFEKRQPYYESLASWRATSQESALEIIANWWQATQFKLIGHVADVATGQAVRIS